MSESLRKFIVAGAKELASAENGALPCVHLIYRIGEGGVLQRAQTFVAQKRSLMGLYDGGGLATCDTEKLCRDISSEITRRGYNGVVLDFQDCGSDCYDKIEYICLGLSQRKIQFFLPIELAGISKDGKIIVPSSVSGGSINEMLSGLCDRYTPSRLCIELIRAQNDFTMPSYKPEGAFLAYEDFQSIIAEHSPTPFFSEHLGCKYFTYRKSGETHFVLYDDTDTAVHKLKLAHQMGLYGAFLLYSEWGEDAKKILSYV